MRGEKAEHMPPDPAGLPGAMNSPREARLSMPEARRGISDRVSVPPIRASMRRRSFEGLSPRMHRSQGSLGVPAPALEGPRVHFGRRSSTQRRESHLPALGLGFLDTFEGRHSMQVVPQHESELLPVLRSTVHFDTVALKYQMVELAGNQSGRVQVDNLEEHGFTTEDLSRVIYDKFKETDLPEFLENVTLEKRGGLDRIGEIWSPEKYFWFASLVVSMVFNTTYLLTMDWAIIWSFTEYWFKRAEGQDGATYSTVMEGNTVTADIFKSSTIDTQTRWQLLNIGAAVATWEVCWIFTQLCHSLYIWYLFALGSSEYRSFHAITYFFQKLLPQFSTFSAIKLMAMVHPSLIYNEYLHFVNDSSLRATNYGLVLVTLYFAAKCLLCASAAVGAFAIKLMAVSTKLTNRNLWLANRLGGVLALMLQCMGCVTMEIVLQDRLFLFVFGGQDAMYKDLEHAYKNAYECRVARQIWNYFWCEGKRLKAIVLLATFDHCDLQRLLIERLGDESDIEVGMNNFPLDTVEEEVTPRRESDSLFHPFETLAEDTGEHTSPPRSDTARSSSAELHISVPVREDTKGEVPLDSAPLSQRSTDLEGMHALIECLGDEKEWRDSM